MRLSRKDARKLGIELQPGRHKYRVGPASKRTAPDPDGKPVIYASIAEAGRAIELAILKFEGEIRGWKRQVRFPFTDLTYIADFVVTFTDGSVVVEDVKGFETPDFKRVRRLWPKYGPCPLKVLKPTKTRWWTETIEGRKE